MMYPHREKLVKDAAEELVEALEKQPFVIVLKNSDAKTRDVQITIMAVDPRDAVVLAAKCMAFFKSEPIVELMPFLEVEEP